MRQVIESGIRGVVVDSALCLRAPLSLPSLTHLFFQWLPPCSCRQAPIPLLSSHMFFTAHYLLAQTGTLNPGLSNFLPTYSLRIHSWERNSHWLSSWVKKDHVDKTRQPEVHIFGGSVERNVLNENGVGWAGNSDRPTILLNMVTPILPPPKCTTAPLAQNYPHPPLPKHLMLFFIFPIPAKILPSLTSWKSHLYSFIASLNVISSMKPTLAPVSCSVLWQDLAFCT